MCLPRLALNYFKPLVCSPLWTGILGMAATGGSLLGATAEEMKTDAGASTDIVGSWMCHRSMYMLHRASVRNTFREKSAIWGHAKTSGSFVPNQTISADVPLSYFMLVYSSNLSVKKNGVYNRARFYLWIFGPMDEWTDLFID